MQPLYVVDNVFNCNSISDPVVKNLHLHSGMVDTGVHSVLQSHVIEMDWLVDDPVETNSLAKPHSYSR